MASAVRRIFTDITRFSTNPGGAGLRSLSANQLRTLSVTSYCCTKSQKSTRSDEDDEALSKPIKFSTSKGSHRNWKVHQSMGSTHQRPWWRVLPLSILCICFVTWCVFRKETEIDRILEKQLYEHLPGLLPDVEQQEKTDTQKKEH